MDMRKLKALGFSILAFAMAGIFVGCSHEEDHYYLENFENTSIYISIKDMLGNRLNDSTSIAKVTGFKKKISDLRFATQERPFDYEDIKQVNGYWYYVIVPSSQYNVTHLNHDTYQVTDTLTLGQAKYKIEELVNFTTSSPTESYNIIWLKVDGEKTVSDYPDKKGFYISLAHK